MIIKPYEYIERYVNDNPPYSNEKDFVWGVEYSFYVDYDFEDCIGPIHYYKKWLKEHKIDYQFNKIIHIKLNHKHSFVYFMFYNDIKTLTKDKYNDLVNEFSFYQKQAEEMKKLNKLTKDFE